MSPCVVPVNYEMPQEPESSNTSYYSIYLILKSRDSVVCIATGYGLDERGFGVRVPVGSRIFFSPRRPDRLWGPPSLLTNGTMRFFHGGKAAGV
jgi:hypothetical protein